MFFPRMSSRAKNNTAVSVSGKKKVGQELSQ